jgi:selenocysteine-specific elongation factor
MRAIVFGTAGHIDHGKTSLVAALTGVDCDRLPEEKRRGITLVLGFAPMADPEGELELSFIDVPGHERLVHTMIAGAGGIDRALLVVAADEGIMPQTREHLDILHLLGVAGGVVALTKSDLLDPDLVELRTLEIREALAGGPLGDASVVACSALAGTGIEMLRRAVLECARDVVRRVDPDRPFRLSVDRAFSVPGAGTVVTGTARWGSVRVGDELLALPSRHQLRVRGIEVHGGSRPDASVAERVAISLAGATVAELPRGEQLLGAGSWPCGRRLAIEVELLPGSPPLGEGERVWVHLLAARIAGRVERCHPRPLPPGSRGRVVVSLASELFAAPGDRVVLRRLSPAQTLGGGLVLDSDPPRLRRKDSGQLAELPGPGPRTPELLQCLVDRAGIAGLTPDELASRLGTRPAGIEAALGQLLAAGSTVATRTQPPVLLPRCALDLVRDRARELLEAAGGTGLPVAELLSRLLGDAPDRVRAFVTEELRRQGVLREVAGRALAAEGPVLADALVAAVEELYRKAGLEAPSPEEAARQLAANPKTVDGLVRYLIDARRLARVGGKWVLHRELLDSIAASVQSWDVTSFDIGQFKDRFGLTRKLAIPILEWLDTQRVTRREGERRRVLPARAGTPPAAKA